MIGAAVDVMSKARSRDDPTQPILPLRQGILEQQTHDYIRHGTAGLFAALEVATGKVTADSWWHVRHGERAKRVADPFTSE